MYRWSCFSPTYLGPNYPRGLFGAIDSGQETAVRFFTEWNDQAGGYILYIYRKYFTKYFTTKTNLPLSR